MATIPCWVCAGSGESEQPTAIVLRGSTGTVPASRRCTACGGTGRRPVRQPVCRRPFG